MVLECKNLTVIYTVNDFVIVTVTLDKMGKPTTTVENILSVKLFQSYAVRQNIYIVVISVDTVNLHSV